MKDYYLHNKNFLCYCFLFPFDCLKSLSRCASLRGVSALFFMLIRGPPLINSKQKIFGLIGG